MASATTTLTATNFNATKLTLESPEEIKGRKGSWSAKLKYDDDYFLIQTPKLFTPIRVCFCLSKTSRTHIFPSGCSQ